MNEIIKNILLDEFKYMNKKKECIGLICISTFSFFLLSSNYSELNKILRFVLIITPFMAIYSTIITIISKSKDVYNNLWMSIPINSYLYSFSISIIVYYRHYISKMIPLFFPIIIRNLLNMKIGIYEGILFLLILSITNYLPIILSLFIYDILRKKMKLIYKKRGKSKNSISYDNISIILLKREFKIFFNNKIILFNHFMYLIFALIFLFNLQIQENIILKLEIIPIIFLSLVSTPSIMYSIEKQGVLLYKLYPVNLTKILVLKYIFNIIIILPEFFILLYFSNIGSIYLYIYLMIHLIVTTFIKLLYDYKVPILKYNNVQQLMENKRKYKIWGTILILSLNILVYYYCNSIIFIGSYILLTILIIMKITKFKDRKDNIDRVLQNKIF